MGEDGKNNNKDKAFFIMAILVITVIGIGVIRLHSRVEMKSNPDGSEKVYVLVLTDKMDLSKTESISNDYDNAVIRSNNISDDGEGKQSGIESFLSDYLFGKDAGDDTSDGEEEYPSDNRYLFYLMSKSTQQHFEFAVPKSVYDRYKYGNTVYVSVKDNESGDTEYFINNKPVTFIGNYPPPSYTN